MTGWAFTALGEPAPQGSMRGFVVNGRAIVTADNKRTKPWRQAIIDSAPDGPLLHGPVAVYCVFTMPRPKSAPKRETIPSKKPDLDKLTRAALDAVKDAGLIEDDARVAEFGRLAKVWTGYDHDALRAPGVLFAAAEMGDGWVDELLDVAEKARAEHWKATTMGDTYR